jgi:8-oxo-dGTP pyrophosphatase MutT (NUDIX family)
MEEYDASVEASAIRETHEEVGIEARDISVIGYLPTMPSITAYAVTPVVGLVRADVELVLDPREVDYAFEVPLSFLLDASNDTLGEWDAGERKVPTLEFQWEGERIWGLTAMMIRVFREILLKQ